MAPRIIKDIPGIAKPSPESLHGTPWARVSSARAAPAGGEGRPRAGLAGACQLLMFPYFGSHLQTLAERPAPHSSLQCSGTS